MNPSVEELQIPSGSGTVVSALSLVPAKAHAHLVLAHGAGAGMRHPFLETLSRELASFGVATLRYQFPYMEHKRRVQDSPKILTETVRAAVLAARGRAPELPL